MHILLAIVGVVGGIGFFIWRMSLAARGARELADVATDAVGAVRRANFRRKATGNPLSQLEDPREAVAALMVAVAKAEGDLTQKQIKVMEALIKHRLEFDDAEELIAHARWLTQDAAEPGMVVQRVSKFVARTCSQEQKEDLLALLNDVASINGEPSALQLGAIRQLMFNIGAQKRPPA